jgi:hypothetical protein
LGVVTGRGDRCRDQQAEEQKQGFHKSVSDPVLAGPTIGSTRHSGQGIPFVEEPLQVQG